LNVLLIDFGSTYTKITAVDLGREAVIGTAKGFTTVETDITEGLQRALDDLFSRTGKLEFSKVLGCSSAAGGLKMVAIGLVPELTAEAAKRAALGAGAKVLGVFCHELSDYELSEINALEPDIILLAGGTDGGNRHVILHNASMLTKLQKNVPVVVAGNKSVAPEVVQLLKQTLSDVVHTENVMPKLDKLNIDPARQAIRRIFFDRIVKAKGLDKANRMVNKLVMPTPAAVLKAAEILGVGTENEPGLGDIMVLDIGGATTDVYSIAKGEPTKSTVQLKGLEEPFAKRTVEGDLGMRYSATALLKAAGAKKIAGYAGQSEEEIIRYVEKIDSDKDYLPQTAQEQQIETAMGKACTALAADRHVGQIETFYSPCGSAYVQTGKDLMNVTTVIGTGGVIVNHTQPEQVMEGILFDEKVPYILKPQAPDYYVDGQYILSAMGLLVEEYPDMAVRMMKKYLTKTLGGKHSGIKK
jgi:uncharacterized protein (TIGR01319 family)